MNLFVCVCVFTFPISIQLFLLLILLLCARLTNCLCVNQQINNGYYSITMSYMQLHSITWQMYGMWYYCMQTD